MMVCRICLEEIVDKNYVAMNGNGSTIQKELLFCIPELNINLIPNAAMCMYCVQSLYAAYNFKNKALQNEKKMLKYIQETILPDLEKIMLEIRSDNQIDVVVSDTTKNVEVIYICEKGIVDEESCEGGVKVQCSEIDSEPVNSFLDAQCEDSVLKKPTIQNGQDSSNSDKLKVLQPYNCSQCSFGTKRSFLLKRHVSFSHTNNVKPNGKNILNCNFCKFTTFSKSKLNLHANTHKSRRNIYKCIDCSYTTSYKLAYLSHNKIHIRKYKKPEKQFICSKCSFKTSVKVNYDRHMKNHLLEKNFKCNKCNYQAKNAIAFRRHSNIHSTSTVKCRICKFECLEKTTLAEHIKIHKNRKQYKCTYCSFTNSSKRNFDAHRLIHIKEKKPFSCKLCNYKAAHLHHINSHMKFHVGNRPYKCNKCNYNVSSSKNLEKHVMDHHNIN